MRGEYIPDLGKNQLGEVSDEGTESTNGSGEFLPDISDDGESGSEHEEDDVADDQDEHEDSNYESGGDEKDEPTHDDGSQSDDALETDSQSLPDEYLFCPQCYKWVKSDCSIHPTNLIGSGDEDVVLDQKTRIAVAIKQIPADAVFGPCKGLLLDLDAAVKNVGDNYLFEINTFGTNRRFLYSEKGHWSAHITRASDDQVANIYALQIRGEIFFRAIRDIDPDEPLVLHEGNRRGYSLFNPPLFMFIGSDVRSTKRKRASKAKGIRPVDTLYVRIPGEKPMWQCRRCPFQTEVYSRIRYHGKLGHRQPDEKFTCTICSKELATPSSLDTHMKLHNLDRKYACQKCDWSFRMRHHLERHCKRVHGNRGNLKNAKEPKQFVAVFECSICEEKFSSKAALNEHVKISPYHNTSKPLPPGPAACSECGRVFKNESALKVHIKKKHQRGMPVENAKHVCDMCGKGFVGKSELRYHLMRHTNEFPFKCSKCNFGYPTQSELTKHLKKSKKCNRQSTVAEASSMEAA